MSSIVKVTDKRSGLTYAYRSESYWDKEKKAPRNRRTLIGRVDPETGEIKPTDGRRKKKQSQSVMNMPDKEFAPYPSSEKAESDLLRIDLAIESMLISLQSISEEVTRLRNELKHLNVM